MTKLSALERAALQAVLKEFGEGRTEIEGQVLKASVVSRENTGGGFFTALAFQEKIPPHFRNEHLGQEVYFGIEGLNYGLGIILHLYAKQGPLLEGYAVAPENTAPIDFEQAGFALILRPGPLPPHGGWQS